MRSASRKKRKDRAVSFSNIGDARSTSARSTQAAVGRGQFFGNDCTTTGLKAMGTDIDAATASAIRTLPSSLQIASNQGGAKAKGAPL